MGEREEGKPTHWKALSRAHRGSGRGRPWRSSSRLAGRTNGWLVRHMSADKAGTPLTDVVDTVDTEDGSDRDYGAIVSLDHAGEEGAGEPDMRKVVDVHFSTGV
jgi:hypothetical protein